MATPELKPDSGDQEGEVRTTVFISSIEDNTGHDHVTYETVSSETALNEIISRDSVYAVIITNTDEKGKLIPEKTLYIGDGEILPINEAEKGNFCMGHTLDMYKRKGFFHVVVLHDSDRVRPFIPGRDVLVPRQQN